MTAIELSNQKVGLIKDIIEEANEDVIMGLISYLRKVKRMNYPCCFTDEEKKERIEQSVKDAQNGLGIFQESMVKRHPLWK